MCKIYRKNNGFTLIELLVVIVIIGILSTILLLLINPKDQAYKAEDSEFKAVIDGVRIIASEYFISNNKSYNGLKDSNAMKELLNKYPSINLENSEYKWATKANLSSGKVFCRDSTGYVSEKAAQDITDYMCD